MEKYQKYPYMASHPVNRIWYAHYRENGQKRVRTLKTRDERDDEGEFVEKKGRLVAFFGNRDLKAIRVQDIIGYINHRLEDGAAPNTLHKELMTVSAMFRYAMNLDLVMFNPVLAAKKPKIKVVRENRVASREELVRILECMYPPARRCYLTFCKTACRASEIFNRNVEDAGLERRKLLVVGKGDKVRYVPMNYVVCESIRA